MQPQAPANPAETFAKMPRMEAMEHPTTIHGGLFWGPRKGAERRGDLVVQPITVAVVQQPRRSTHVGLRTYSRGARVVRRRRTGCCFCFCFCFWFPPIPDHPSGTCWLLHRPDWAFPPSGSDLSPSRHTHYRTRHWITPLLTQQQPASGWLTKWTRASMMRK